MNFLNNTFAASPERASPLFIFTEQSNTAYNWLDAGNWMWGNAVNRIGGTREDAQSWSRSYNKNDSDADWRAILSGWLHHENNR